MIRAKRRRSTQRIHVSCISRQGWFLIMITIACLGRNQLFFRRHGYDPEEMEDAKPNTVTVPPTNVLETAPPPLLRITDATHTRLTFESQIQAPIRAHSKLRLHWEDLPPQSEIAIRLQNLQRNCSLPYKIYEWRKQGYGMGSDIHVWSNHLWAGLFHLHRLKSPNPWIWADGNTCKGKNSTWLCYFPNVEPTCPNEVMRSGRILTGGCDKYVDWPETYSIPDFRAAATEFVFSSVAPSVIQEAERQLQAVFGDDGVPSNLILVHVRWGDKVHEGSRKNNPINVFIQAVEKIVKEHSIQAVNILLCTEDPKAEQAFRQAAPISWNIHLDQFYAEFLPFRKNREVVYNLPSLITMELQGKPGLWALGSLLVAMEANYYVLTTKSNWARLINELRKNVLNPRCANCTYLIDLEEGEC